MNVVEIKFGELRNYDWNKIQNILNDMAAKDMPFFKDFKGIFEVYKKMVVNSIYGMIYML